MANCNKVNYGGKTLIDLTADTVTKEKVLAGCTFHKSDGSVGMGTMVDNGEKNLFIDPLTQSSVAIPEGYTSGGTVTITDDLQNEVDTQTNLIGQISAALSGKSVNVEDETVGSSGQLYLIVCDLNESEPLSIVVNDENRTFMGLYASFAIIPVTAGDQVALTGITTSIQVFDFEGNPINTTSTLLVSPDYATVYFEMPGQHVFVAHGMSTLTHIE